MASSIDELIDERADEALEEIRQAAQIARLELGLPLVLYLRRRRAVDLPERFQCPDCGGRVFAEIDEWEVDGGRPTREGVNVFCSEEWEALMEERDVPYHRNWFSDWFPLQQRAIGFVRRRVRVAE
jgi:hypothetical protein